MSHPLTSDIPPPLSRSRASSLSASHRPTTPLRRLSASSLRNLSLSHSRSRPPTSTEPPLHHLGHIFAELADALADLGGNLKGLEKINSDLDGFNHAFSGYLYGLRLNAYTADFDQAPTKLNFDLGALRTPVDSYSSYDQQQQQNQHHNSHSQGSLSSDDEDHHGETFITNHESEFSFIHKETVASSVVKSGTGTRGGRGGTTVAGGRGGRGGGRGGKVGMTKKKRDEWMAFADSIIQQLPIKYREQQQPQRSETESIISVLRDNSPGIGIQEFSKQCQVPTHRINETLTALVRAKIVLKVLVKGVTSYRLDPAKYPPQI